MLSILAAALLATQQPPVDSGTIRIHLLGHAIGAERYALENVAGRLVLTDTFTFTDRGGKIQLASSMQLSRAFEPVQLTSIGRTYRFVNVDADVSVISGKVHSRSLGDTTTFTSPKHFFPIAAYAPLEAQAILVRYWLGHGRPKTITIAPADPTTEVSVEDLGVAHIISQ